MEEKENEDLPFFKKLICVSQTWDRECHGLFDFDLQDIETITRVLVGCGYVQRKENYIRVELPGLATEQANENNSDATKQIENLISVVYKND